MLVPILLLVCSTGLVAGADESSTTLVSIFSHLSWTVSTVTATSAAPSSTPTVPAEQTTESAATSQASSTISTVLLGNPVHSDTPPLLTTSPPSIDPCGEGGLMRRTEVHHVYGRGSVTDLATVFDCIITPLVISTGIVGNGPGGPL
ncbi:hypothetical protein NA57DRAFT_56481 [Rhizodiscina lignyota]|uniref:Uncharacterized protein n=1 Tax=Rhizodiscina lignyota TaxID=1504668 RepID=A0A9P4IGF8_9PEZI|nr:hypothetical protein NA57DRAFT_56481 [Rhizodiscina lignyota]